MTSVFLSYARGDDEPFLRRLYDDLTTHGLHVWFDRISMPSRELAFLQEIRDAIAAHQRLLLVIGPKAKTSDYVIQEWKIALEMGKPVTAIVRLDARRDDGGTVDGYALIPDELALLHAEDFRDDSRYAEHFANLARQLSAPAPPLAKLFSVPTLPRHYLVQRDRLLTVKDALLLDLRTPVVVTGAGARIGVQGMGGIGKSVLAAALARDLEVRRAFPDGIFWIGVGQQPNLVELQRSLAKDLGDEALFGDPRTGKQRLKDLLAERAALLVLDNLWQSSHAVAFDVLGPRCKLLLTTRDTGLVSTMAGTGYQVQLPTEPEAFALLANTARVPLESLPQLASEIVAECGSLPLALALCGGMAAKKHPWERILRALREARLELIADRHEIEEHHRSIWRAMEVSIQALPPDEQQRFAELAVFATDAAIPEAAVLTLWSHTGGLDELAAADLLVAFSERSLVESSRTADAAGFGQVRVAFHDLLHDFATRLAAQRFGHHAALHDELVIAYRQRCAAGWPTGPNDGYFFQNLRRHLMAAGKTDELVALLLDLDWLEAKCVAGLVHDLQTDYSLVLERLTPLRERQLETEKRAERLGWYEQEPPGSPPPPTKLTSQQKRLNDKAPRIADDTVDRLGEFSDFLTRHSHLAALYPSDLLILARNQAASGTVAERAEGLVRHLRRPWIARDPRPPLADFTRSRCLRTLAGHLKQVNCVSVAAQGRIAVSASNDETLRVWDLATGECLHTLYGHHTAVKAAAVSADGRASISGGVAKVRKEGTWLATLDPPRLDTVSGMRYFLESEPWDGILRVWDLTTGRCKATLRGPSDRPACIEVWCLAITPDGRIGVAGGVNVRKDNRADFTIHVWDLLDGNYIRALEGHTNTVSSLKVTPDGKVVVSSSYDGTVRMWSLITGNCSNMLTSPMGSFGFPSIVYGADVTADGQKVVSVGHEEGKLDENIHVWNVASHQLQKIGRDSGSRYRTVAIEPAGNFAVSDGEDDTVCLWNLETGELLDRLEGHSATITSIAVAPKTRIAVSASEDTTLRVWSFAETNKDRLIRAHRRELCDLAMTANRKTAVSAGDDPFALVWNLDTKTLRSVFTGHGPYVRSVQIAADDRTVISRSSKKLLAWDIDSGQIYQEMKLDSLGGIHLLMSPDGMTFLLHDINKTEVRLVDVHSFQTLRSLDRHFAPVRCTMTSPDARKVITGAADAQACVFDIETGRLLQGYLDHDGDITSLATTPDGRMVVSASDDRILRVWDIDSGQTIHVLEGHTDKLRTVALTPDGRTIVSTSNDETIRIWATASGRLLRTHEHLRGGDTIKLTADGSTALTRGSGERLLAWNLMSGEIHAAYYPGIKVTTFSSIHVDNSFVCGTKDGQVHFLELACFNQETPVVTATRMFRIDRALATQHGQLDKSIPVFAEDEALDGADAPEPTVVCPWCACCFVPPKEVLKTISRLTENLHPTQSPCLVLASESWDDPQLLSVCPNCGRPLKVNPFVAGQTLERPSARDSSTGTGFLRKEDHQISYYEGKLRKNPHDATALQALALYFGSQGDWAKATSYSRRAVQADPTSAGKYTQLALALLENNEVAEAIEVAQDAVEKETQASREKKELGETIRAAFTLVKEGAGEKHPELGKAWLALGLAFEAAGEREKAVDAYQQGTRADSNENADIYFALGNLFGKLRRWDETLDAYDKALKIDSNKAMVCSNMAYALQEMGDEERALTFFSRVTEIDPSDAVAWYDLAAAHGKRGDLAKAIELYEKSYSLDPNAYKTTLSLALAYEDMSDWTSAAKYYARVLPLTDDASLKDAIRRQIEVVGRATPTVDPESGAPDA